MPSFSQRRAEDLIMASMRAALYPDQAKMPEHELVRSLAMSRTSIRAALRSLSDQGMFTRVPRAGTVAAGYWQVRPFASAPVPEEDSAVGVSVIDTSVQPSAHLVSRLLGLEPGQPVGVVEAIRRVRRQPLSVSTSYVRADSPDRALATWTQVRDMITDHTGPDAGARGQASYVLGACRCDASTATVLAVDVDSPLLWEQVEFRDPAGAALMVSFTRHNPYHVGVAGTYAI